MTLGKKKFPPEVWLRPRAFVSTVWSETSPCNVTECDAKLVRQFWARIPMSVTKQFEHEDMTERSFDGVWLENYVLNTLSYPCYAAWHRNKATSLKFHPLLPYNARPEDLHLASKMTVINSSVLASEAQQRNKSWKILINNLSALRYFDFTGKWD